VIKETFMEANVRVDEEFDSVEKAHLSNGFGDNAKVKVLDFKIDKSRIKLINKEQNVRPSLSEKDQGAKGSAARRKQKDE
jgi:ribosomal protein S1